MSLREWILEQARKDRAAFARLPKHEQQSIELQWAAVQRSIREVNAEAEAGRWSNQ